MVGIIVRLNAPLLAIVLVVVALPVAAQSQGAAMHRPFRTRALRADTAMDASTPYGYRKSHRRSSYLQCPLGRGCSV